MTITWKLIVLVCVTIVYSKSIKPKQSSKLPIEFDDILPNGAAYKFGSRGFGGTWISGNEFTYTTGGNFVKYNVETKQNETILAQSFISQQGWSNPSFRFSPDLRKILVRYAQRQIFRHSTVSKFSIITPNSDEPEFKIADGSEIQTAFFAPNSKGLGYIKENDIYYLNLDALGLPEIITTDGIEGVIYNGIPDWVYEEEVLGTDAASWFSPNGEKLAYVRFDDREVQEALYELYDNRQYPEEIHLRYPKAGTKNPTVGLFIVDVKNTNNRRELAVPLDKVTTDHIIGTVFWINNQSLSAIWLNRRQNRAVLVQYDATTFEMDEIMEISEPNGWIDVNTPKCDANSVCYFINNNSNWPRLTSIDTRNKQDVKHLSDIGMNVLSIYGIQNGTVYYLSTPAANESFNRHSYSTNGCLTCNVKSVEGNTCTYASTTFSSDFSHYVMACSGPDPSFTRIFRTNGNEMIQSWEENEVLRETITGYDLPQTKIFTAPVDGDFSAVVKMQVPSHVNFEAYVDSAEKYPMLVRVYAGPGSVRVANTFGIAFQTYQTTKKNIIYVEIDGRGTGQNGNAMKFSINNRLGTYEMEDQIDVTEFLIDRYKFIDPSRISIWGWSYGGYATAMTLAKDTEKVFKCGISVAPVTSWRFYDTIYTERYMGIDSNATNYIESDVSTPNHIENIGKHDFFLIHGNADDNVHYQQSMVLARELEKADITFEQLSYPDEAHSISGTQRHLYHAMDRFWDKCFNL